jgi:hypothetical protein
LFCRHTPPPPPPPPPPQMHHQHPSATCAFTTRPAAQRCWLCCVVLPTATCTAVNSTAVATTGVKASAWLGVCNHKHNTSHCCMQHHRNLNCAVAAVGGGHQCPVVGQLALGCVDRVTPVPLSLSAQRWQLCCNRRLQHYGHHTTPHHGHHTAPQLARTICAPLVVILLLAMVTWWH